MCNFKVKTTFNKVKEGSLFTFRKNGTIKDDKTDILFKFFKEWEGDFPGSSNCSDLGGGGYLINKTRSIVWVETEQDIITIPVKNHNKKEKITMKKTYTFTIRDLTNEAQELKNEKERIEKEENIFFKRFVIESNNILQVINNYLERLYEQLQKFDFNIRVGFGSVEVYISVNTGVCLTINHTIYKYKKLYRTFVTEDENGDFRQLEENSNDMSKLLSNWSYVKKALEEQIQHKYEIEKTNLKRREDEMKHLSSLLKNFNL